MWLTPQRSFTAIMINAQNSMSFVLRTIKQVKQMPVNEHAEHNHTETINDYDLKCHIAEKIGKTW